jgi:lysophospholipase L1-like esterase
MMATRALQLISLALALSACGGRAQPADEPHGVPAQPAAARGVHVVVLGSSTAAGAGLTDPETSWVRRYAAFLTADVPGSSVTNLAVGGYSTYQIQPTGTKNPSGRPEVDPGHNIDAALALHPDALIVNLPSNDAAMGVPVADSLANIEVVAKRARAARVPLWVTTSQPRTLPPEQTRLLADYRDRIRGEYGAHALDFFTPLAGPDATPLAELNVGDGIHPNAEGHRRLFEQVRAADLPGRVSSTRAAAR